MRRATPRRKRSTASLLLLLAGIPPGVGPPCRAASPRTGDLALTTAVGVSEAVNASEFHSRGNLSGSLELHWSARNSIRASWGFVDLPAAEGSDRGQISGLYVSGNASHNWFAGPVFPYVTGGLGLYALEEKTSTLGDRDELEVGLNAGVGFEVRLRDPLTVRVEGIAHVMTGDGPSTVAIGSVGLKYYF